MTTHLPIPAFSAYPVALSDSCAPGGDGQCDGFDYDDHEAACECPCHESDLGSLSISQITKWHEILHTLDGNESSLLLDEYLTEAYVLLRISLDEAVSTGSITDSQADTIERQYIAALEADAL